jgi:hypothetical protein
MVQVVGTFFGRSLPGLAAKGGFGIGNIAPNVMNYLVGTGGGPAGFSTKGLLGSSRKIFTYGYYCWYYSCFRISCRRS